MQTWRQVAQSTCLEDGLCQFQLLESVSRPHSGRRPFCSSELLLLSDPWGRGCRCAGHIGTRPAKSVTSHCQKWLIKLCVQGKLPPPKVIDVEIPSVRVMPHGSAAQQCRTGRAEAQSEPRKTWQ